MFGDIDGVVVVPQEHALEIFERAERKIASENRSRDELQQGRLLGEVYAKYGVL